MPTYSVLAPAKVNLTLHVLARRGDGFHAISSLMVPLSLGDEVVVEVGGARRRIAVPGHPELAGADNLCLRAARALDEALETRTGVFIRLKKRVPIAAGLGGGSSDAAAVLRCLARHHGISVRDRRVQAAAEEVGSDVPFFLRCRPALVTGRGEHLEPAPPLPAKLFFVIVKPPFGVSAREAYDALAKLRRRGRSARSAAVSPPRAVATYAGLSRALHNDLEAAVETLAPIEPIRARLRRAGARAILMSGSGSCVFSLEQDEASARKRASKLALLPGEQTFLARALRHAPRVRESRGWELS